MTKDTLRDRIALFLWRDRNGYQPSTGRVVGELQNTSLLTRARLLIRFLKRVLAAHWRWLVTTLIALAALALSYDLHQAEAEKKMNAPPGELTLKCVEQAHGVLACRKTVQANH